MLVLVDDVNEMTVNMDRFSICSSCLFVWGFVDVVVVLFCFVLFCFVFVLFVCLFVVFVVVVVFCSVASRSSNMECISQRQICWDICKRSLTETKGADLVCYLKQLQYTDTGSTSPRGDHITIGVCKASH